MTGKSEVRLLRALCEIRGHVRDARASHTQPQETLAQIEHALAGPEIHLDVVAHSLGICTVELGLREPGQHCDRSDCASCYPDGG